MILSEIVVADSEGIIGEVHVCFHVSENIDGFVVWKLKISHVEVKLDVTISLGSEPHPLVFVEREFHLDSIVHGQFEVLGTVQLGFIGHLSTGLRFDVEFPSFIVLINEVVGNNTVINFV